MANYRVELKLKDGARFVANVMAVDESSAISTAILHADDVGHKECSLVSVSTVDSLDATHERIR